MKGKMNILVIGGFVVLVVMFALSGYLLFRGISRFSSAEKKADKQFKKLKEFYRRNPFPSGLNVDIGNANAEKLNGWSDSLLKELRKGNVRAAERSPSRFMAHVGATRNKLLKTAEGHDVRLASEFAFGFDRYLGDESALPPPQAVPRLTQQLVFVQDIVMIMVTNGVHAIDKIEREALEEKNAVAARPGARPPARPTARDRRQGRSGRRARPKPDVTDPVEADGASPELDASLYSTFSFAFEFRASERVLLGILNQLAGHRGFLTVTSVEARREDQDIAPVGDVRPSIVKDTTTGEDRELWPTRQERIISGPGHERPMRIRLGVDVFRFTGDASSGSDH